MITVTLLWNKKRFAVISADKSNIRNEIIKKASERSCKEEIPGLNYMKFSKNINMYTSTELRNVVNGDVINIVTESGDEKVMENEHLSAMRKISRNDESFEDKLLEKVLENGFLTGDYRKYIFHFFKFHENCRNDESSECAIVTSSSSIGASSNTCAQPSTDNGLHKSKGKRDLDENGSLYKQPLKKKKTADVEIQCQIAYVNDFEEVKKYLKLYPELPSEQREPKTFRIFSDMLFDERRAFLMNSAPTAKLFKELYPYMFSYKQMIREFELITRKDKIYSKFESQVRKYCSAILTLAPQSESRKMVIKKIMRTKDRDEKMWLRMTGSLLLLPHYMEENRKGILICNNDDSVQNLYPYIHCASTSDSLLEETASLKIIMEGEEICRPTNLLRAYLGLLAIHYVFNAEYDARCTKTFSALELFLECTDQPNGIPVEVQKQVANLEQILNTSVL